jgi:hypothetical protein
MASAFAHLLADNQHLLDSFLQCHRVGAACAGMYNKTGVPVLAWKCWLGRTLTTLFAVREHL